MNPELTRLQKLFRKSHADCLRLAGIRGNLGPDSSRARITTANARWARAAEERDRIAAKILDLGGSPWFDGLSESEGESRG